MPAPLADFSSGVPLSRRNTVGDNLTVWSLFPERSQHVDVLIVNGGLGRPAMI